MSKLSNKVVLITGGAGNIGSYILDKVLYQNPKQCIVIDNLFNSDKSNHNLKNDLVKFYPLDISRLDEMQYIFETYKPNYVFHCASMLIQDSETLPRKSIDTNITGTFNIVDLSNRHGVEKICYSSSASVYGEPQYLPVDEEHPFQYKNFVYGMPFINLGIPRAELVLQQMGYRGFDDLFGMKKDPHNYYKNVEQSIELLDTIGNMPLQELEDILNSETCMDRLRHNQEVFKEQRQFKKLLVDLESICDKY